MDQDFFRCRLGRRRGPGQLSAISHYGLSSLDPADCIFNRTLTLRDTWAKILCKGAPTRVSRDRHVARVLFAEERTPFSQPGQRALEVFRPAVEQAADVGAPRLFPLVKELEQLQIEGHPPSGVGVGLDRRHHVPPALRSAGAVGAKDLAFFQGPARSIEAFAQRERWGELVQLSVRVFALRPKHVLAAAAIQQRQEQDEPLRPDRLEGEGPVELLGAAWKEDVVGTAVVDDVLVQEVFARVVGQLA